MSFLFENINKQYLARLPFVVYAKPNSNKITAVLQKDVALHLLENEEDKGFVLATFDGSKKILIPADNANVYFENWDEKSFYFDTEIDSEFSITDKEKFETLVTKALQAIADNNFTKVVLSRAEIHAIDSVDVQRIFQKLMAAYPSAFNYIFYHPEIGFWIAATPERLLNRIRNTIQTVSLAGTQVFSENLVWQEKEINEQAIVTQYIIGVLNDFSTEVAISKPYTQQAGQLAHLKTDIKATCKTDVSVIQLVEALHPTPAVCGFPKDKAMKFIVENEGYNRSFYAGFLGEWNIDFTTFEGGNYDLYVNLRCVHINDTQATLFVGCGINSGSNPEKEFIETVNKSKTIKKVIK